MTGQTTFRYQPFANGSQFMDWKALNCERCALCGDDGEYQCEIEDAIDLAAIDDGTVSQAIARRMGYLHNNEPISAYVWPCPEAQWTDRR